MKGADVENYSTPMRPAPFQRFSEFSRRLARRCVQSSHVAPTTNRSPGEYDSEGRNAGDDFTAGSWTLAGRSPASLSDIARRIVGGHVERVVVHGGAVFARHCTEPAYGTVRAPLEPRVSGPAGDAGHTFHMQEGTATVDMRRTRRGCSGHGRRTQVAGDMEGMDREAVLDAASMPVAGTVQRSVRRLGRAAPFSFSASR